MKILDKPRRGQIGIVRHGRGRRAARSRSTASTKEMRIDSGDLGDARDGDLVEVAVKLSGRLMIQKAKVTVGHRQPAVRRRDLDDRHPQSRNPLPLPRLRA